MDLRCPNCNLKFDNATEEWIGADIECQKCGHIFTVPENYPTHQSKITADIIQKGVVDSSELQQISIVRGIFKYVLFYPFLMMVVSTVCGYIIPRFSIPGPIPRSFFYFSWIRAYINYFWLIFDNVFRSPFIFAIFPYIYFLGRGIKSRNHFLIVMISTFLAPFLWIGVYMLFLGGIGYMDQGAFFFLPLIVGNEKLLHFYCIAFLASMLIGLLKIVVKP